MRRKPCLTLKILPPVEPPACENKRQQTIELMDTVYETMNHAYWE